MPGAGACTSSRFRAAMRALMELCAVSAMVVTIVVRDSGGAIGDGTSCGCERSMRTDNSFKFKSKSECGMRDLSTRNALVREREKCRRRKQAGMVGNDEYGTRLARRLRMGA